MDDQAAMDLLLTILNNDGNMPKPVDEYRVNFKGLTARLDYVTFANDSTTWQFSHVLQTFKTSHNQKMTCGTTYLYPIRLLIFVLTVVSNS